ncbi:CotD family spore coat protein [Mesobacillus foraminis]|nr:CotD family spore coat protein [Mesobacillus foraminis]
MRVENYYPVTESNVNETIVEEYNCGSDINNPCCKLVKKYTK